jgi:hypothetical protein
LVERRPGLANVGDELMVVKFDGQVWVTEPRSERRWKQRSSKSLSPELRFNDGTMIRAEVLSNVREE